MSKKLPADVRKARRAEREAAYAAARAVRASEIKALIAQHGSANRVAKALGVSAQAFYEKMDNAGLSRPAPALLPGEPRDITKKPAWLQSRLAHSSVVEIAERYHRSPSAIHDRMRRYGLRTPGSRALRHSRRAQGIMVVATPVVDTVTANA